MLKVMIVTLLVGHFIWLPIFFVMGSFGDQDGSVIANLLLIGCGFMGSYYWLQSIRDRDETGIWEKYDLIWGFGILLLPAVTALTYAWLFVGL